MSHGVRHGRAHSDRRVVHNDVCELEHRLRQRFRKAQDRLPLALGKLRQRNREKYREHRHLQNLILRGRLHDIVRKNVQQKIVPMQRSGRAVGAAVVNWVCVEGAAITNPSPARLKLMAATPRKSAIVVTTSK